MFCGKCGKQIEEKSRFCPYCGEILETNLESLDGHRRVDKTGNVLLGSLTAVDIVIVVAYGIVTIWWTSLFFKELKFSWLTFGFLGTDAKFIGMVLYIIPYALILSFSIIGIHGVRTHRYHISTGVIIGMIGLITKIGSMIVNDMAYKSYEVIATKIFTVYGSIGLSTIFISIVISVLLYAKLNGRSS